jgi:hypothetical protein
MRMRAATSHAQLHSDVNVAYSHRQICSNAHFDMSQFATFDAMNETYLSSIINTCSQRRAEVVSFP